MSANPHLQFTGSVSPGIASHQAAWFVNNVAAAVSTVAPPFIPGTPYTASFAADNPTITLQPGDVVHADVAAIDGSGLSSVKVPVSVTVPANPPAAPTGVTLTL
jgi:hypothetical protein